MNSSAFDEFGRMTANLGLEAVPATPGLQNVMLYPYTSAPTEIIDGTNLPHADVKVTPISMADGTQIWKITHNGVDTHPIHFHLYDVQVLNRVTWDNIIIPPDASELGWKDTVRVSPLEDTIVALRPIIPALPFDIPNSVRELDPMMPDGAPLAPGLIADPQGNPVDITNHLVNFGWEYVYHCHILSHEEMDMMRPVLLALPPVAPSSLTFDNQTLMLSWTDNSLSETSFVIAKSTDGITWTPLGQIDRPLSDLNTRGDVLTYTDATYVAGDQYRVAAINLVGDPLSASFPTVTTKSAYIYVEVPSAPAEPTNLTAALQPGLQVNLAWQDNSGNETSFVIERSLDGLTFSALDSVGLNTTTYVDGSVLPGNTYTYQVKAVNVVGDSPASNQASVSVPVIPADPTNLTATVISANQVDLGWTDNATSEEGFVIQRSNDGGATWTKVGQTAVDVTIFSDTSTLPASTYLYQVYAFNIAGNSMPSNSTQAVTPDVVPAAPTNLTVVLQAGPQLSLAWTDNANNETSFVLERSLDGVTFSPLTTLGSNVTSFVDNTVVFGSTYTYRVAAFNLVGTSAYATSLPVTVVDLVVPVGPNGLFATNITQTSLTLNWVDNSTNEAGFTVQIATNQSFTSNLQTFTVGANVTSFNFTGLARNIKYYFRVQAFNSAGASVWSPVVNFRTLR